MTQSITVSVWERWMREYVPNLIERRKWLQDRQNLRVGDVVIVILYTWGPRESRPRQNVNKREDTPRRKTWPARG